MLYKCHPHPTDTVPVPAAPQAHPCPLHGMVGSPQHGKAEFWVKQGWLALVRE